MPAETRIHLVFLPGMMCDERVFKKQIQHLETHEVISLSVAGFASGRSMQDYAHSVYRLLQNQSGTRVFLVGLSMGGIIAMQCMKDFASHIAGVVLMDTNPLAESVERKALRSPQIARALAGELDSILIEEMKPQYLAPANQQNDEILSLVLAMARDLGPAVFSNQSEALMGRPDYTDVLQSWTKSALILCGKHDSLCPVERHEMMHSMIQGSVLKVMDNAGHLPTLETSQCVNACIENFVFSGL